MKMIVGVDGSIPARHAVECCAKHSGELRAEVVVVYAFEVWEGQPMEVILKTTAAEDADLVVGRRGLGNIAERLLGSTSNQLTHHLDRPLVIPN